MNLLIIQNDPLESLGLIEGFLSERGHRWDTITTYDGYDITNTDISDYDAMIVMGGRYDSWEERYVPLHHFIRDFINANKGYLGVCLGAQMVAIAMGGRVEFGERPEVGHMAVSRTAGDTNEPILNGFDTTIPVFQWHQDCITNPPDGATNLLSSDIATNQLIKINDIAYGMQFHWDIDNKILSELCAEHDTWLAQKGTDPQTLITAMETNIGTYKKYLYRFMDNWFGLMK